MVFNSFSFVIFLPIVFALYWLCGRHLRLQNLVVVIASYVFYGWWDWRFLFLIAFTSTWAWLFGLFEFGALERSTYSKVRLILSFAVNIGILGYFKYYDFFAREAAVLLQQLGFSPNVSSLKVILPVGISFYTFQALSYTIDVYKRSIKPTKDVVAFFAYISFFPQLVAGPIERATNLLPQFLTSRSFSYPMAVDGCRQMLWGFFKKMVIADGCAALVNIIFAGHESFPGSLLLLGAVLFAFQIYGDFSGYSDIAIGCAKLFGFKLMRNFNYPYFSRDIAEFWRRWHISLTTWFRDYLYIPIGGSKCSMAKKVRNTFVVFLVSGLWHGANWTFIVWGFVHACLFLPLLLFGVNRRYAHKEISIGKIPSLAEFGQMLMTFLLVCLAWVFFRAENISMAISYFKGMFSWSLFSIPPCCLSMLPWLFAFVLVEWLRRDKPHVLYFEHNADNSSFGAHCCRWVLYFVITIVCIAHKTTDSQFIYFQF